MAKKRRRQRKRMNRPNIPEKTLAQVTQADGAVNAATNEHESDASDAAEAIAEALHTDDLSDEQLRAIAAQQRVRQLQEERYALREARRSDRKRKKGETLDGADIARLLANPTKEVTEADLRKQYSYVLADLRNMGILAAILFGVLIGLGLLQTL